MKRLVILIAVSFLSSCELFDDKSKTYELEEIQELYNEIVALSESVSCTNSAEWKLTPMGSKACGGPTRYIAYHQSVESRFLGLVTQYTELQAEYNKKNNIPSDCAVVVEPRGIVCENGKPVFIGN
ncbi:hypothetical protein SAMN03080617_02148 [Algoriphagus alkaliphilus]|uniref:Lipoprotein n=1 Tax=Algoriphagus alkaliphilus TaxID=279824 RepID=A0A1G5Y2K1_9BACT|nr:hypothetical protein [Algoriphagus alkaliphilus]MBA4302564.1 hypothetical protein [Cyclobacterium sp.]SDA76177.1 hypothetical protein SAMN03080617_02148 [Algoriphagus alkaliphilus]